MNAIIVGLVTGFLFSVGCVFLGGAWWYHHTDRDTAQVALWVGIACWIGTAASLWLAWRTGVLR